MTTQPLLSLPFETFKTILTDELGLEPYRAKQVWDWLFLRQASRFEQMTNLSKEARAKLSERFPLIFPVFVDQLRSKDGTRKVVIPVGENELVEAVAIPGDEDSDGVTYCLSCQVGCQAGCTFCRTGAMGFKRNLTREEIILQVLSLIRVTGKKPTNIVFMGMGEPFFNREAVFGAIDTLTRPEGLALATRRITVSTVGVPAGIRAFSERPGEVNLAVSLHAADDTTRSRLVPLNKKYPLKKLREAIEEYLAATNRRVTFEVALLQGVNDGLDNVLNLVQFCEGLLCHVNLIAFNPFPGCGYKPAPEDAVREFKKQLKKAGVPVTLRRSKGADIMAACGQLAGK